jgi:hypothetical protein
LIHPPISKRCSYYSNDFPVGDAFVAIKKLQRIGMNILPSIIPFIKGLENSPVKL